MPEPFITLDNLLQLPEDERIVLMGLAGVGLPAGNSHLARLLAGLGRFPAAAAWAANPRRLQDVLETLQGRGLAAQPRPGYWACSLRSLESAARLAHREGVLGRLHRAAVASSGYGTVLPDACLRMRGELRLAVLEGGPQRWLTAREQFAGHFGAALGHRDLLALVCGGPFEPSWFEALAPAAQAYGCQALLYAALLQGDRDPAFLAWLESRAGTPRPGPGALPMLVYLACQGRSEALLPWMTVQGADLRATATWPAVEAMAALAGGDPRGAAARFGASLERLRGSAKARSEPLLPGPFEPFHVLALVGAGDLDRARARIALLERLDREDPLAATAPGLARLVRTRAGADPEPRAFDRPGPVFARALDLLGAYLEGLPVPLDRPGRLARACAALPLGWLARELEELAARTGGRPPQPSPLLDLAPRGEPWQRALERIQRLGRPGSGTRRLAWFLAPAAGGGCALEAREQAQGPGGAWTTGEPIPWGRLREEARAWGHLLPQDQRAIACLQDGLDAGADLPGALAALAGHPWLFSPDRGGPVELAQGQPELRVRARGRTLEVTLDPAPVPAGCLVRSQGTDTWQVFLFTDLHQRLADLLGERLVVPTAARERLLAALAAVAPLVPVRSELPGNTLPEPSL